MNHGCMGGAPPLPKEYDNVFSFSRSMRSCMMHVCHLLRTVNSSRGDSYVMYAIIDQSIN